MTNLGVLTKGAMHAINLFEEAGYEVITFHAIGAGGEAMEQMMKEGIITAVFDYAMGEIADATFDALRASGPERLTVAGKLGLPQVICPGGSEHLGLLVQEPSKIPAGYEDHMITCLVQMLKSKTRSRRILASALCTLPKTVFSSCLSKVCLATLLKVENSTIQSSMLHTGSHYKRLFLTA